MEVTGIQSNDFLILRSIANVEVVRAHGIAFQTDTENLRLDTILHVIVFFCKDFIQRVLQQSTIFHAVHGDVLATIMHPQVHDTRIVLTLTHLFGNGTTTLGVLNPKITDSFIRIRQGQVARLRMRERCGIEVQLHVVLSSPLHPALEMRRFYLITIYKLTTEVTIYFVQIQAMVTRNQRSSLEDIGTQFIDIASLARIVARSLNATGQFACRFKAGNIVCLPTMKRQLNLLQLFHHFLYIDTDSCITFHGQVVRLLNLLFIHSISILRF